MGALHEGHASLVRRAAAENDFTAVSIFVNPTQFGPNEDFSRYPRTLEADAALLAEAGADLVFAPSAEAIYPAPPAQITFSIRDLDQRLCGLSRPGHMNGVLQVVAILFNLVRPGRAYFGLKDYQQWLLIRQMARELHFPVEVVPCPIVREADGLAMSSRNRYLEGEARAQAQALYRVLSTLRQEREQLGSPQTAQQRAREILADFPLARLDYIEVLDGRDLSLPPRIAPEHAPVAFIAAWLGPARLIDNMPLYPTADDSGLPAT
jgi:pantoate--beta-alanine ligase